MHSKTNFPSIAGDDLPEDRNSILTIRNVPFTNIFFTSSRTVLDIIHKLPNRKDLGEDAISNVVLRNMSNKAILALTHIINGYLYICYFPSAWKCAIIVIPKIGKDMKKPTSYRPIALLCLLLKVLEWVILSLINSIINHKIREEKFAFKNGHSTTLSLIKLTNQLCLNNKIMPIIRYLEQQYSWISPKLLTWYVMTGFFTRLISLASWSKFPN